MAKSIIVGGNIHFIRDIKNLDNHFELYSLRKLNEKNLKE